MITPWSDMTDRERDAALARLIGWSPVLVEDEMSVFALDRCFLDKGDYCYAVDGGVLRLPSFTTSLDAMRQIEDMIDRRLLWLPYTLELGTLVTTFDDLDDVTGQAAIWRLIRATPARRAEAAWRVLIKDQT